jgi:hypothetical protein
VGSVSHKTSLIAFGLNAITLLAVMGLFLFRPALALDDASSSSQGSDNSSTNSASATSSDFQSTDTTQGTVDASAPNAVATSTDEATSSPAQEDSVQPTVTSSSGLKEVHIIGTKYVDYFSDGTTVTSYPGDPQIDAHLSEPNASTPTHEVLTWVHTTWQNLYDTPSGDLEVGDYALQANGEYIEDAPPFVSSTSTPAQSEVQTATSTISNQSDDVGTPAQGDASTSQAAPVESTSTSESSQTASRD